MPSSYKNYFAPLLDDDDDDNTIANEQTHHSAQQLTPQHKATATALSDSGATSHFLVEGAQVTNKRITVQPITITLPDGNTLQSTHTCNVDIPWIRGAAPTLFPDLRMPLYSQQQNSAMQGIPPSLMPRTAAYLMAPPWSSRVAEMKPQTYGDYRSTHKQPRHHLPVRTT